MRVLAVSAGAVAAIMAVAASGPVQAQSKAKEQFFPVLVYRTGPYAPNGAPWANGYVDYLKLINARDGGINGVKITYEECETGYDTARGVECYERLKGKGPTGATVFQPLSTGITFALTDKAPGDKIPLVTAGYGRADSVDGTVFKWNFPLGGTYWDAADILVQHVGKKEGGLDKLKGKKIALVYHDSPYGKEPIPMLQERAKMNGFQLLLLPVTAPGVEQKATWLQIRQQRPDYVFLWGWGVMNSAAIKEAVATGYPREKMFGVWWSGAEPDVIPAGADAKGYNALVFLAPAGEGKVHQDVLKYLYDKGKGTGPRQEVGQILYNRGLVSADARCRGRETRPDQVRQEAAHRRAGALGPGKPCARRRRDQEDRLRGLHGPDSDHLRRPRRLAQRPHRDLGREEVEYHRRPVRVGPADHPAADPRFGGEVCGGEENHPARLRQGSFGISR